MAGDPTTQPNLSFDSATVSPKVDLARRAMNAFIDASGQARSFEQLAVELGVDVAVLREHFDNYDGLYHAAFEQALRDSEGYRSAALELGRQSPDDALRLWCSLLRKGWSGGLKLLFSVGLTGGIANAARGPIVVDNLLEPTLASLETLLTAYDERGLLDVPDSRSAAISFLSPLVVALIHQDSLNGVKCRPLDVDAFVEEHVWRFLRAHARQAKR